MKALPSANYFNFGLRKLGHGTSIFEHVVNLARQKRALGLINWMDRL